jgi:hypothetical protein
MTHGDEMRRFFFILVAAAWAAVGVRAQTALDWQQVQARFQAANPAVREGLLNISESKAAEITAYLRPNPNLTTSIDQLTPFTFHPYQPISGVFPAIIVDYLHERAHKRELRLESAQQATSIAVSQQNDLVRTLLFGLRSAFVQTLQAKAVLALARDNLEYFDRELAISRDRLRAGDIAPLDLNRIALQRVQYESDLQTALVNMRTAKIMLLELLDDRTLVDRFDVTGAFDFSARPTPPGVGGPTPGRISGPLWRPSTRPKPTTDLPSPTVPPIPPSPSTRRATRPTAPISDSASTSPCVSSTAIRAKNSVLKSTSLTPSGPAISPPPRSTATSIPPTSLSPAPSNCSSPIATRI